MYCEWAPNEKVACEVAIGASIAGARSFCAMKHVGLNVAADPLFTASYTGVNGGMVLAVADDPGMHSSQNEQDSRHYAIGAKVPMLEPSDSQECKDYAKLAYEISEKVRYSRDFKTYNKSKPLSVGCNNSRQNPPRYPRIQEEYRKERNGSRKRYKEARCS